MVESLRISDVLIVTMDTSVLVQADRLESATTKDTATVETTGMINTLCLTNNMIWWLVSVGDISWRTILIFNQLHNFH